MPEVALEQTGICWQRGLWEASSQDHLPVLSPINAPWKEALEVLMQRSVTARKLPRTGIVKVVSLQCL